MEDADAPEIPAGDGQIPAERGVGGFADEIQALKMKLLELERQAQNNPAAVKGGESRPQLMDALEEYRRMEACLKNHRKEWERASGPGNWGLDDIRPRYYMRSGVRYGTKVAELERLERLMCNWKYSQEHKFDRPSLSELSREVAEAQEQGGADTYDEFDEIIDYGSRRDRLRKNFEWEMDRLYLVEEMDRRRKEKIEAGVHGAEAKAHPAGDEQPEDAGPKFAQPQLNRLNWSAFKALAAVKEKDAFAVDILMGEPNIDDGLGGFRHWFGFSGQVRKRDIAVDSKTLASMLPGQPQLPERVRIHSEALTRILGIILGTEINGTTVVFIRPFKVLAYCERALRDWCTALEKKFEAAPETNKDVLTAADGSAAGPLKDGAAPQEPGKGPGEVSAEGSDASKKPAAAGGEPLEEKGGEDEDEQAGDKPDDMTKSPAALDHLKCLLSFVDSDISVKQTYLKSPDCRKVFFSDLWYLFRPGVEVTGSDGRQAYRIIGVTSAKHRVVPYWERWSNNSGKNNSGKSQTPPFSIACVYIDFDGENVGPVPKVFEFKRFDGERDVTSLEVYPLRFHQAKRADFSDSEWKELEALPATERYRQKLKLRGSKFLEVAGVKHMYYAGPTVEAREEVESQVVIDFETAFSVEDPTQKLWKPELKTMIGIPEAEDGDQDGDQDAKDKDCMATCCLLDNVHDDSYVDKKQREEYVNGLLPEADAVNEQPSIAIIPRPLKELRTSGGSSLVSDEELTIMSYRVFGFVLRSRKWGK